MTTTEARDAVKRKFKITVATLNDDIDECVSTAVDLLSPYVKRPVVDETLTGVSSSTDSLTPTALVDDVDIRSMYVKSNELWEKYDNYRVDGNMILLKSWLEDGSDVRLFLKVPFTIADIEDIPAVVTRPMVELACAEFATMLAGDKSRYNIYSQATGARAVDNMIDLAEYYEGRAERRLQKLSDGEGLS